ncbi:serine/threonine-protein kinase ATM-like [Papaver somniferum]|uniref:serine/threonine-protein kinase ATM-like n=1 Tax=Papaver somniferum TaxID=3469 RepID=UPI000E6FCE7C|nr:serine/threonine-protein kinase ATM-like [Papaver somniferum]
MSINLAKYVLHNNKVNKEASNYIGWLESGWLQLDLATQGQFWSSTLNLQWSSLSLKKSVDKKCIQRQCQTHFHLVHYSDALFRSYEERLFSNEWQAALRLRKYKAEKMDLSIKIQELQKQLTIDKREDEKLQVWHNRLIWYERACNLIGHFMCRFKKGLK